MSTTVFNIANYILKNDANSASQESCKNFNLLQLMKLCYLSYGWYWAYHDKELFKEEIQAWKYGPVIPELYYSLKHFKNKPLLPDCLKGLVLSSKPGPSRVAQELINAVINHYGQYSGMELSALTHKPGTPWYKVYKPSCLICIPDKEIKSHFDVLKDKVQNK